MAGLEKIGEIGVVFFGPSPRISQTHHVRTFGGGLRFFFFFFFLAHFSNTRDLLAGYWTETSIFLTLLEVIIFLSQYHLSIFPVSSQYLPSIISVSSQSLGVVFEEDFGLDNRLHWRITRSA